MNDTKKRIIDQFEKLDMLCWVTKGKEIENYIPADAVRKLVNNPKAKQCHQYDLFPDYIEKYSNEFKRGKVAFANRIAPLMTRENCRQLFDIQSRIKELYKTIEKWNM